MGVPMRLIARIERIAARMFEASYNIEPDVGVFVGSVLLSGEYRFVSEERALAWIKETASAFGIKKEKIWIEIP
jgi:hypothetical protein